MTAHSWLILLDELMIRQTTRSEGQPINHRQPPHRMLQSSRKAKDHILKPESPPSRIEPSLFSRVNKTFRGHWPPTPDFEEAGGLPLSQTHIWSYKWDVIGATFIVYMGR